MSNEEFVTTFNNSNQMMWYGNGVVMQIIKFDGTQMMMTVCVKDTRELYTISANRIYESDEKKADMTNKNRLILHGRNLTVFSEFNLGFSCIRDGVGDGAHSKRQFSFGAMLLNLIMCFLWGLWF
jgi:hypothetical protein